MWLTDWLTDETYDVDSPFNDLKICPRVAFVQFVKLWTHYVNIRLKEKKLILSEFIPDATKLFS